MTSGWSMRRFLTRSDVRCGASVASVEDVAGGLQIALDLTFEVRDAPKPACVAQVVYRYYR